MKIADALNICPDFSIGRDNEGRVVCGHLIGGEVCRLPTHFNCELVTWKQKEEAKKFRLPMISHSRAGVLEGCPRSYFLSYIAKAQPPVRAAWKDVGREFANARAKIDSGQPWAVSVSVKPEAKVKLEAILKLYEAASRPQVLNELPFAFEHKGYMVNGYIDAISVPDRKTLFEWKYAQSDDTYTALTLARQLSVYMRAFPAVEQVVIAVARKTRHAQGKTETFEEFNARVVAEYAKVGAAQLITFKTFPRSMFHIERELDCLVELGQTMKRYTEVGIFPPNYWKCQECDWEKYCVTHTHVPKLGVHEPDNVCEHPGICEAIRKVD